ncbi:MAG: ATP-binding protein, partial [Acidobacteriota bacterium]
TLDMLHHRLTAGVRIRKDYDFKIPCIPCDPRALNQAWMNLMENALDAIGGNGELGIRTRLETDRASVEVIDNGPGIPEKIRAHVFEPFFTTKPPGLGTGLGLDTVYRIVRQHNGDVTFDSQPGATKFRVRLPVRRQYGI